MSRSIVVFLVIGTLWVISPESTYGQSSSRKSVLTLSADTQQAQETPSPSATEHCEVDETVSDDLQPLNAELSASASQTVAVPTPHDVLDMSTSLRTPTPTKINLPAPIIPSLGPTSKQITLACDRFAHRELLFEEPIHERHGIADRPFHQLTKSTIVFFGRSLLLPGTLITKKHLRSDSGEGWRESQGDQVCP